MQQTFEHLLGLPAEAALAILQSSGIAAVAFLCLLLAL